MNYSVERNKKNDTVFLGLIIILAILIRAFWAFFLAEEYWGDAYHNIWIVKEFNAFGTYYDYKDRHLVWLPLYRFLLISFEYLTGFLKEPTDSALLPFLLQICYVLLVAKWAREKLHKEYKLIGIIILVLWPLPIIFSGLNMAESLSLVLVTLVILKLMNEITISSIIVIIFGSAAVALTRHEGTAFLFVIGSFFLILKDYKRSTSVFGGLFLGLFVWSLWNWSAQGQPLFWLTSKFIASGSGAEDVIHESGVFSRGLESMLAILFVFPLLPILFSHFQMDRIRSAYQKLKNKENSVYIVLVSTVAFLIIFFAASFFFFHGADPKYLLVVSFPCSLFIVCIIQNMEKNKIRPLLSLVLVLIPVYMTVFFARAYNLALEKEMGKVIRESIDAKESGKIWADFPPVLVYAEWEPKKAISSEQLNHLIQAKQQTIFEVIEKQEIQYIVTADADRSQVLNYIPEIRKEDTVIVGTTMLVKSNAMEPPSWTGWSIENNLFDQLQIFLKSKNRPIYLFEVHIKK